MTVASAACGGEESSDTATGPGSIPPVATAQAFDAAALCLDAVEETSGTIASPTLVEISGLAYSGTQDVIWAHNDSGDAARIYAMSPDGDALTTYTLSGADAVDWEDMALGPGPDDGVEYLYLGDIGDNASIRPEIVVYRVPEPVVESSATEEALDTAVALILRYPDGAHDAETLLSDPITGDLYVVSKDISGGPSGVYRAPAPHAPDTPITLELVGEIDWASIQLTTRIAPGAGALPVALPKIPTGGDIAPDGSIVAIRTYGSIWLWARDPAAPLATAFGAPPCEPPSTIEPQGEAIAFTPDGRGYVTASEGANVPLNRFHAP